MAGGSLEIASGWRTPGIMQQEPFGMLLDSFRGLLDNHLLDIPGWFLAVGLLLPHYTSHSFGLIKV